MKLLAKIFWIFPLIIILFQVGYYLVSNTSIKYNPISTKNLYIQKLKQTLNTANIYPIKFTIHEYENEVEFSLKNSKNHYYKVFISSTKNILSQVNALQKIIKIANIKEKEIHFIDLSSKRPYATL